MSSETASSEVAHGRGRAVPARQFRHGLHAVDRGHHEVERDVRRVPLRLEAEELLGRRGRTHLEAEPAADQRYDLADRSLVVQDQKPPRLRHAAKDFHAMGNRPSLFTRS